MPVEKRTQSAEMCETEAIERVKQGDPSGMARLYELHNSRVYSLCLRYTSNAFDADDLTQDIFIQVLRKICTFRGEAQFASWLYKVALNFVRLHARQQRRHGRVFAGEIAEQRLNSVKSRSSNPTQRVALTQALSCLTPVRRMTLLLHDIQGFSHNEVASRMGITVIASKSRLHRAHAAMRNILGSVPAAIRQT